MGESSTSTPLPAPLPDPGEYASLVAYANFRLLLLTIPAGQVDKAEVMYDSMQQQYPQGKSGSAYAENGASIHLGRIYKKHTI